MSLAIDLIVLWACRYVPDAWRGGSLDAAIANWKAKRRFRHFNQRKAVLNAIARLP